MNPIITIRIVLVLDMHKIFSPRHLSTTNLLISHSTNDSKNQAQNIKVLTPRQIKFENV